MKKCPVARTGLSPERAVRDCEGSARPLRSQIIDTLVAHTPSLPQGQQITALTVTGATVLGPPPNGPWVATVKLDITKGF